MTAGAIQADAATARPAGSLPSRQPGALSAAAPPSAEPPAYDLDRVWDLLARTCDLPDTERELLKVLAEYRKALHALVTHMQAERDQQPHEPGTRPRRPAPEQPVASDSQRSHGPATSEPGPTPRPGAAFRPSTKQAQAALRPVLTLFHEHRELLTPALEAGLRELHDRLSERLCPYTTAELEASKDKLDKLSPDYDHWYIRSGTAVIWCDRRKDQPPA